MQIAMVMLAIAAFNAAGVLCAATEFGRLFWCVATVAFLFATAACVVESRNEERQKRK